MPAVKQQEVDFVIDGFIGQRMVYMPGQVKKRILADPRISDLYITHIGIFPKARGHLRKRPLGCSQYILIYCVEGEGWIETEGVKYNLNENQLFVIPPKTACSYGASLDRPWTNYWIHFTGENSPIYCPPLNRVIHIPPTDDNRIEERLMLFEEMMQHSEHYFMPDRVLCANIALKQFLTSVRYLSTYRLLIKEPENDRLDKVIAFMKCNLNKSLRIGELAETCNCSASNLYKLFRKNIGTPPQDYFIHLKMERARRYLSQTNLKIKEVAHRLGYTDPYYFSRIFTRHTGLSPANYRREER